MNRQGIMDEISRSMGSVPDWLQMLPDPELEHIWGMTSWFMSDSKLSARDKALIGLGAATAVHCPY